MLLYAKCRILFNGAEYNYAQCHYADFHYAHCHYAECRGAVFLSRTANPAKC